MHAHTDQGTSAEGFQVEHFLKSVGWGSVVVLIVVLLSCSENPSAPFQSYTPPVVFNGFINGVEVSLGGNFYWANRCYLKNDTMRMHFYSDKFYELNRIRHGDFLRIDFYPHTDTMVGTRNVLVHLARYYEGNSSYNISPRDSMNTETRVQMHRVALAASHGHRVEIDEIYMRTPAMSGTSGQQLEITKGIIKGAVE